MFLIAYIIIVGVGLVIAILALADVASKQSIEQPIVSNATEQIKPISDIYRTTIDDIIKQQPSYKVTNAPDINQSRIDPFSEN